jgi:hypothetical protein
MAQQRLSVMVHIILLQKIFLLKMVMYNVCGSELNDSFVDIAKYWVNGVETVLSDGTYGTM